MNLWPFIFSMDKCGSTTVMRAIQSAGMDCGRAHDNNIDEFIPFDLSKQAITVAREPVAWAISYYWEMKNADHPIIDVENYPSVKNFYDNMYPFTYPLNWYDVVFRQKMGVNVYGNKTSKRVGWKIISVDRLLILRTHRLNETLAPALSAFLGLDESEFTVEHRAMGSERFGPEYEEFQSRIKLDRRILRDIYMSKYCDYFFTMEDRKGFMDKWKK